MPYDTHTMFFIKQMEIPQDRTATYLHIFAEKNIIKVEQNCIRWIVGGNLIN